MKTTTRKLLLLGLACLTGAPLPAFDDFPVGARPAAMGGAGTALADDVHAVYYNPAGLATLYRPEVTAYYARLFPDLSDQAQSANTFVGGAMPLPANGKWGGLGFGFNEFRVDDVFKEREIMLGYGRQIWREKISAGVTLKQLTREFGNDANTANAFRGIDPLDRTFAQDPVFRNGHSASALGIDLGALYSIRPNLRVGLALLNFNRPDVGLVQDD